MEVLLETIIQIVAEFILEVLGGLILDAISHGLLRLPWLRRPLNAVSALLLFFGLGVSTGFLSLLILPIAFVRSSSLPGISLLITPTLVGSTMGLIGWLRRREGRLVTQLESFVCGFVFAFGMASIRFYFTD
jgi:hypothetical protein